MRARYFQGAAPQSTIIGLGHADKALAKFVIVGSHQRIGAHHARQTDMVFQQHQITDFVGRVDAAGGVGENDRADAEFFHDANRESDLRQAIALVEVSPPLLRGHHLPFQLANDQIALMAMNGGWRPARDFRVRHYGSVLQFVGQAAQTRTQDQTDRWLQIGAPADGIRRMRLNASR